MKPIKIVVTGGAGFIGSHIVDRLLKENYSVVVLDNFSTGKRENLKRHENNGDLEIVERDVRDFDALMKTVEGADGIFHEAAVVSVPASFQEPKTNFDINSTGTFNVLEAARLGGVGRVVIASSTAVYGEKTSFPIGETAKPEPMSPYGYDKLCGELQAEKYGMLFGIEVVSLRYFNVYGPRQDSSSPYSGVISKFAARLRSGLPLEIYGSGEQTRDFIYVEDIVDANMKAMFSPVDSYEVFNVATGRETSVKRLASTIMESAGVKADIVHKPGAEGDIFRSLGDIKLIRLKLGFKPRWNLKEGLSFMLADLKCSS